MHLQGELVECTVRVDPQGVLLEDLRVLAKLVPDGVEGAIVGKALYAQAFTLEQALETVR